MSETKQTLLEFLEANRKRGVDIYGQSIPDSFEDIPIGVVVTSLTTTPSKVVTVKCKCGMTTVSFDERDKDLDERVIRSKWPRGHCNRCNMIVYANALHFVCGDW